MARKNDSPQKVAMREMMRDYLKSNGISIKNGTDVNFVMRDSNGEYEPILKSELWIEMRSNDLYNKIL